MVHKLLLSPTENLVGCSDTFIEINKGRDSFWFKRTDKLSKAFFSLHSFLDAVKILFVLKIALFDLIEGLFFRFVVFICSGVEKIIVGLHLLKKS